MPLPWISGFSNSVLGGTGITFKKRHIFSGKSKTTSHKGVIAQSLSCLGTGGNIQRTPTQTDSDYFGKTHFTVNLCKKEGEHIHWPQSHFLSFAIFCSSSSSISEHQLYFILSCDFCQSHSEKQKQQLLLFWANVWKTNVLKLPVLPLELLQAWPTVTNLVLFYCAGDLKEVKFRQLKPLTARAEMTARTTNLTDTSASSLCHWLATPQSSGTYMKL